MWLIFNLNTGKKLRVNNTNHKNRSSTVTNTGKKKNFTFFRSHDVLFYKTHGIYFQNIGFGSSNVFPEPIFALPFTPSLPAVAMDSAHLALFKRSIYLFITVP